MQATAPLIDLYDHSTLMQQINTVVNDYSGRTYPMRKSIPVLLHDRYMQGNNEKYQRLYNFIGNSYDWAEKVIDKLMRGNKIADARREMMMQLDIKNGDRVLCVSVGTGIDLTYLPDHVDVSTLQITGVDISMGMLNKCKKNLDKWGINAQLVNCCAEALPFEDNYFDVVFHVGGINLFTDQQQAVHEMIRVAKPGAKILISDETEQFMKNQYEKGVVTKIHFSNRKEVVAVPVALIPDTMENVEYATFWKDKFYRFTFNKPLQDQI